MKHRIKPKKGQESAWDYPRPPRIEPFKGNIKIVYNSSTIVDTRTSFRILETSHPPTYYIPIDQFKAGTLVKGVGSSFCEFKGMAHYYDIVVDDKRAARAAWGYSEPSSQYKELQGCVSVYAHLVDACFVNGEKVEAQEGDFYGGWITSNIVGPFKGGAGTWGW